ncbi:MAG: isopenicillin N synthase family dioxygenase [Bacteriovoracaceae bacterium]
MTTKRQVPELSLLSYVNGSSTEQVKFVDNLFSGLKDYGFIILKDHTVDTKLCSKAYDLIHEFFSLSEEKKLSYVSKGGGGQRGYTAFGTEHAKYSKHADLKEFWHVGRDLPAGHPFHKYYPENIWVKEIPEFQDTFSKLYSSLDVTSVIILNALGKALDVPENYFKEMVTLGNSILRPIHYPPLRADQDPNCVRSAEHEDVNLITILMGATTGGLELLDRNGEWLNVATRTGELVVDSGDMLSRITNDIIPATTHRVVNPKNSDNKSRYSMPFFVHPNPEVDLKCIPTCVGAGEKYPPINSHEFLMNRLKEIGLKK